MLWRLIPLEINNAATNMALDEACLEEIHAGNSKPTIRFYRWQPAAVSIGYFQNLKREIDLENCAKLGIDTIRRQTGGGAVYHDFEGELTYSVIAPLDIFPKNIIESYQEICGWLINGFQALGIEAEFKPINDLIVGDKKISGNAQVRRKGVLLQHGTILYKIDVKKMFSLLKVPDEKIRDKMIKTVEERITSMTNINPQLTFDQVYEAFVNSFTANKDFEVGKWSDTELELAQKLIADKYNTDEWNLMR